MLSAGSYLNTIFWLWHLAGTLMLSEDGPDLAEIHKNWAFEHWSLVLPSLCLLVQHNVKMFLPPCLPYFDKTRPSQSISQVKSFFHFFCQVLCHTPTQVIKHAPDVSFKPHESSVK